MCVYASEVRVCMYCIVLCFTIIILLQYINIFTALDGREMGLDTSALLAGIPSLFIRNDSRRGDR